MKLNVWRMEMCANICTNQGQIVTLSHLNLEDSKKRIFIVEL